jgi:hypothetical protein
MWIINCNDVIYGEGLWVGLLVLVAVKTIVPFNFPQPPHRGHCDVVSPFTMLQPGILVLPLASSSVVGTCSLSFFIHWAWLMLVDGPSWFGESTPLAPLLC